MNETTKTDAAAIAGSDMLAGVFFEKPQERENTEMIEFDLNGEKYIERKIYSEPCQRCEGCPVYRIDKRTIPIAYYCQADFAFGIFSIAIKNGTIPENCRIAAVVVSKHNR